MSHLIKLFMWGYQDHFRVGLEFRTKGVFEKLGAEAEPKVFLVGLRRPGFGLGHPVCVEPEDGEWSVTLFEGLSEAVEAAIHKHPLQQMLYGDELSMREKPTRIRQLTIADEVKRRLEDEDRRLGQRSFCSEACSVGEYDVVCVLQIPERLFAQYPSIDLTWQGEQYETNLVLACIRQILEEGRRALFVPDPGRLDTDTMRTAEEIIQVAASYFMRSPFLPGRFCTTDLFEHLNRLSQLRYEGSAGVGRIVLAAADDPNVEYVLRLKEPVKLLQTRWARKLLQMATGKAALIAQYGDITGLGQVSDVSAPPYSIEFLDHHQWDLRRGDQILMRCRFGEARLPQEPIGRDRFVDNMRQVFAKIDEPSIARFLKVLDLLTQLPHGSSVIIAEDAAEEAARLSNQGTVIAPVPLSKDLLERATAIDGTILTDPQGVCHAIGVILDGQAVDESTPSRGARYNSALRYVAAGSVPRMAFVISEDRTLDVVPLLRPRVDRTKIEAAVTAIGSATPKNYHKPRSFLDDHRFYLDEEQCRRVNEALDRIESDSRELGRIVIVTERFTPHPAMNASYLKCSLRVIK